MRKKRSSLGRSVECLGALIGVSALLFLSGVLGGVQERFELLRFDRPFLFGFLAWQDAPNAFKLETEGVRIRAENARGGAGYWGLKVALRGMEDRIPVLWLKLGSNNRASALFIVLQDADRTTHRYRFNLQGVPSEVLQPITAEHGASIAEPWEIENPGDKPGLESVETLLVVGDWSSGPVDITLVRLELIPPTEELIAQRLAWRKIKAEQQEKAIRELEERKRAAQDLIAKGAPHPNDGPQVLHICAVAPDTLAISIQSGEFVPNRLEHYVPEPSDEIVEEREKDKVRYRVRDGSVEEYFPRILYRRKNGQRMRVGLLSPDGKYVFIEGQTRGTLLDETAVDYPEAYAIQSDDDPNYSNPTSPKEVFRKSKPNAPSRPLPYLHIISLRLPFPLKEGATYRIEFRGVNTAQAQVRYVHRPRQTYSFAVHAIQTGYRPDDPFKRAYYSFWMGINKDGKHGSVEHPITQFELIDAQTGSRVYTGRAELAKKTGQEEQICIHEKGDYAKATVYRLDFSDFTRPGVYRVYVPGVGVSHPFRIARDVWDLPFKASMQAIFIQRQGITLGPPYTKYRRPRPFHPDDGVVFYQLDIPVQAGQEGVRGQRAIELTRNGQLLPRLSGVWGGYQDAGDWDTLGHHLSATYDLLCLYDFNPKAFVRYKLEHLPFEERNNSLPDVLDEALWQMRLWRNLQRPDGGVRGGYGDGWGCYPGETSWMLKYALVYDADVETTYHYAAVAAKVARVLASFNPKEAKEYLQSAIRAWDWAEQHNRLDDPVFKKSLSYDPDFPRRVRNKRALAAVELLATTRDPQFDKAFRTSTELHENAYNNYMDQPEANFAYARLPQGLGDPELKKRAVQRIVAYADHAIEFSRHNAFDVITGKRTDLPLIGPCTYFSTPGGGGMALIYAYELTRDRKYLRAAVQGSNYCLGANPDNLSYCTGVGINWQRFNFIVDALVTGQQPNFIVGHIPYGQGNEGNHLCQQSNEWVQTWFLNFGPTKMRPSWYDWPVYEQYIDFAIYPLMNENCFNQTSVPAACYWFYLSTRP